MKMNLKDMKKVGPLLRCFKAGALSSKLKHELARAADEAEEHDRGGTLFHLRNAEAKSEWLKEIAPDGKTKKLASEIRRKVKRLADSVSGSRTLRLSPEESKHLEREVSALKHGAARSLKHAAAKACGAPEDWDHKRK